MIYEFSLKYQPHTQKNYLCISTKTANMFNITVDPTTPGSRMIIKKNINHFLPYHTIPFAGLFPPSEIQFPPNEIQFPPNEIQFPPNEIQFPPNEIQFPPTSYWKLISSYWKSISSYWKSISSYWKSISS